MHAMLHASMHDAQAVAAFAADFARDNPGYSLSRIVVEGGASWSVDTGVAFHWLVSGSASHDGRELRSGDVLVVDAAHPVALSGTGVFLRIAVDHGTGGLHFGARRLSDLPDTSGGCNVSPRAYRRLQIVWQEAEAGDGDNVLGCHVVHMEPAFSRTHYHPDPAIGGGRPQYEFYLVLDHAEHGLPPCDEPGGVWTCPEPGAWDQLSRTTLRPGDIVGIRAPMPHRGDNVLACVIAIPGFKPQNELYLDAQIAADTGGNAPHNPSFG